MSTFEIGSANYDKRGGQFGNRKYFYVKANEPNIFRVLPPVLSCARTGEYYKYHAVHRNMRASDSKQRPFACPEDIDFRTKLVKQRCPVCDRRREFEAQYNTLKDAAGPQPSPDKKQKLQEFWIAFIEPLKVERQHYMNVVNQAGEIGVLSIPTTLKNDMAATFKKMKDEEGVDPAGGKGIFVNFGKTSQYKGDPKPVYKVDPIYETVLYNGQPMKSYKFHDLTPEFVGEMEKKCRDITSLHRVLTQEELAMLAGATHENRKKLLDTLFSMPEDAEEENTGPSSNIPGTNATTVSRVDVGPTGATYVQPAIAPNPAPAVYQPAPAAPAPQQTPAPTPQSIAGWPTAPAASAPQPTAPTPVVTAPASPAPSTGAAPAGQISDQAFLDMFNNMNKK